MIAPGNGSVASVTREIVLQMRLEDDKRNAASIQRVNKQILDQQEKVRRSAQTVQDVNRKLLAEQERLHSTNLMHWHRLSQAVERQQQKQAEGWLKVGRAVEKQHSQQEKLAQRQQESWLKVGQAVERQQQKQDDLFRRQMEGWQKVSLAVEREENRRATAAERSAQREAVAREQGYMRAAKAHERSLRLIEREQRQMVTGGFDVGEGAFRMARGASLLGITQHESMQDVVEALLIAQGGYDIAKGGWKMARGARNAVRGYVGQRNARAAANFIGPLTPQQQAAGMSYFDGHAYWATATPGAGGFVNNFAGGAVGTAATSAGGWAASKIGLSGIGAGAGGVLAALGAAAIGVGSAGYMGFDALSGRGRRPDSATFRVADAERSVSDWLFGWAGNKLGFNAFGATDRYRQNQRISRMEGQKTYWASHGQAQMEMQQRAEADRAARADYENRRQAIDFNRQRSTWEIASEQVLLGAGRGKQGLDADLAQAKAMRGELWSKYNYDSAMENKYSGTARGDMHTAERIEGLRRIKETEQEIARIRMQQFDLSTKESIERMNMAEHELSGARSKLQDFSSGWLGFAEMGLRNPVAVEGDIELTKKVMGGKASTQELMLFKDKGLDSLFPDAQKPYQEKLMKGFFQDHPEALGFFEQTFKPHEDAVRKFEMQVKQEMKLQLDLTGQRDQIAAAVSDQITPLLKEMANIITHQAAMEASRLEQQEQARQAQARAAGGGF